MIICQEQEIFTTGSDGQCKKLNPHTVAIMTSTTATSFPQAGSFIRTRQGKKFLKKLGGRALYSGYMDLKNRVGI